MKKHLCLLVLSLALVVPSFAQHQQGGGGDGGGCPAFWYTSGGADPNLVDGVPTLYMESAGSTCSSFTLQLRIANLNNGGAPVVSPDTLNMFVYYPYHWMTFDHFAIGNWETSSDFVTVTDTHQDPPTDVGHVNITINTVGPHQTPIDGFIVGYVTFDIPAGSNYCVIFWSAGNYSMPNLSQPGGEYHSVFTYGDTDHAGAGADASCHNPNDVDPQ